MERDELRERIARALYEDAHRHQEPEHFYPWERVQSTIVAKGYHRQADAVLAALSGEPAPTEPPGPITLRYDVEIRTADGALLAGWLDLPTGAHTLDEADEIRRNIFRLDWSDARIEDIRHRPVPTAPVTDPRASTGRIEPMQNPYVPAPTEGGE